MRRFPIFCLVAAVALIAADKATANVTPLWTPLQLVPKSQPTAAQLAPFGRVTGWPGQASGQQFYTYVKGTRSYVGTWPESWYLHAADGSRVHDSKWHSYVMDPRSAGWQQEIVRLCPERCFLDAMGTSGYSRTAPSPAISNEAYNAGVLALAMAVGAQRDVIPNSVSTGGLALMGASGTVATEGWDGTAQLIRAGRVWVKSLGDCGQHMARFLLWRGRGDRFYCSASTPWTVPTELAGPPVGKPLGPAVRTSSGWRREFTHATLRVTTTTYRLEYR